MLKQKHRTQVDSSATFLSASGLDVAKVGGHLRFGAVHSFKVLLNLLDVEQLQLQLLTDRPLE